MKKSGSVTIFVCLIFICISALICGLLESARTSGARLYLQTAGDSAIDSLFSRYHRALWDNYKILSLESESDEKISELMLSYMQPYIENSGMYRIQNPQIKLNKKISLSDNGGMYLEQEIIDYMSLGVFESVFEGSPDDLWKDIEDAMSMEKITTDYGLGSKEAIEVEKTLKRLSENIEKQEEIRSKMKSAVSAQNISEIKKLCKDLKSTLKKVPDLIKKYEKKADRMSEKIREIENKNADNISKLSESNREYIDGEISKFKEYVDKDSERRIEISALAGLSESMISEVEELESDIESLQEMMEAEDDEEQDYDIGEAWNNLGSGIDALTVMRLNFKYGIADEEKEEKLKQVKELISDGIFSLVIPENREVSNKSINRLSLPSNAITGGYSGRNLAQRLLVNEYMGTYFADFTDDIDTPLSYELEYILNGDTSDRINLENAILKILAIREGLNYMHIISDASKMQSAQELATVISGVLCLPQITLLIKFLIIAVWALVESAIDLRCLLSGGKVPLIKSRDDWSADLDSIFDILNNNSLREKEASSRGINYEGYLKMLLYIEEPVKRNFRMMDIMQLDISRSQNDFLINDMVYGIEADIGCGAKRLFSEISFFSEEFVGLDSGYDMAVKVEKIY
ncbi:hypothetical protein J4O15_03305 [Lachnoanaerobaculum sp. Marseille-Q4761]|uniref:DUF5702 domain-containing protein n=1 Tax=Lachnoanaerobaculum sp. Marseille-Q4761 TaxID=2819511 RepID=UPI001AA12237|nr:DUF5702 domain-containing protein [Lachnoanaerobaculum sp. Marseille-Q4761]MBO1869990.1 hypothetical protein [Lachnoanaerobaculum sp. Marseille-Q4761]